MQRKNKTRIYILLSFLVVVASCKKFVDAGAPETRLNAENVYTNDATAIAVMTGLYSRIASGIPSPNFSSGVESLSLRCGLSADEYTLYTGAPLALSAYYNNALLSNATTSIGSEYWNVFYDHIYMVNSALEGLTKSTSLTLSVKKQLLGEAKFMRALFYFYLTNLYGDVPLITSTDYKVNSNLARVSKSDVYEAINVDLIDAQALLSADFLDSKLQKYTGDIERVRPTKWAATALLARSYLYNNDFTNAEIQSTSVIDNTNLFDTVSINGVFLKNSKEAIWQLQPVKISQNTDDSKMFIVTTGFSGSTPVRLSDTLLNSFDSVDLRRKSGNWIKSVTIAGKTYYYPYKYKNNTGTVTEYLMVLRLAEQYLIRAEARAQLNKISEAKSDLNIIRWRAELPNTAAVDKSSLLTAILRERQQEFFSEWGHRWFDLKRTNSVDALMSLITPKKANGSLWKSFQKLYPIPYSDLWQNSSLTQNPDY